MIPNPARPPSSSGVPRMLIEAGECWKTGNYSEAIHVLQRALRLDAANTRVLQELGYAYAMSYDFNAAERAFEEAIRVSASKIDALLAVAHYWRRMRRFDSALNCFERVLEHQ